MELIKYVLILTLLIQTETNVLRAGNNLHYLYRRKSKGNPKNVTRTSRYNWTTPEIVTKHKYKRTIPVRISMTEDCDYIAYYCLQAYRTGKLCARTNSYQYKNFTNYCMMDFVNCMERFEVWQVAYMGECWKVPDIEEFQHYEYQDDFFLDNTYVIQE